MKITQHLKTPLNLEAMKRKKDEPIFRKCEKHQVWQDYLDHPMIDAWHPLDMLNGPLSLWRAIEIEAIVKDAFCPKCHGEDNEGKD